ncbi:MAG: HAMP domain-containing histidine kinase [Opitutae bacterium]|nr:HAMP domain-containing histidine kinase [Opitutae bacterium]
MELLVGDVTAGLLDTLGAMPTAGLDAELTLWQKNNPLVRTAFRCTPDGRIMHPPAGADEEARAFRRRFAPLFEGNPPWRQPAGYAQASRVASPEAEQAAGQRKDEYVAQQQALQNVAKVQSARREAQDVAKYKAYRTAGSSTAPTMMASTEADAGQLADKKTAYDSYDSASGAAVATPALGNDFGATRSGWLPWTTDGRLHLLGWLDQPALGEVRGVEVKLEALIARLGGVLPAETGAGEGYALRDDKGRIMHQTGWIPRSGAEPAARVELSATTLPGWTVVAFLDAPARSSAAGPGLLLVGSLLIGILIVAILAGGSLLLWQARRSEAEAVQKTSFVANVSHEFKTPLTTIRLYAELLEQGRVAEEAKRTDYLRTIGRETERLARLVGNALDFSRLEQGRKKYAREPLDLRAELARLLDTHAPRLAEAGLVLHRSLPTGPVAVTSDRDALGQIVLNLLDNAAKYAAAGGEVTVELAARPAGGAVVRVLDRGPGVPPEHRDRIFEKFHRVDDTLIAEKSGTGLGLSIARQLARGLGGDLRYEPRTDGGAAFILELP